MKPRMFVFATLAWCTSTLPALSEEPLRLLLPIGGAHGVDWAISKYVDLAPGNGVRDYRGGTLSYDGHAGTDFTLPNFRWMDRGVPVLAVADGRVVRVHDGQFDRSMSRTNCRSGWNFVVTEHSNGWRITYGHFRKGSIEVSVGDHVTAGQELGEVGSSGCSSSPHVHLEIRDESGSVIDPFRDGLWLDPPPPYDFPLTLMSYSVTDGELHSSDDIKDPGPDVDSVALGATIGVGTSIASASPGDALRVVARTARAKHRRDKEFERERGISYLGWNFKLDRTGPWTVNIYLNDELTVVHAVNVTP